MSAHSYTYMCLFLLMAVHCSIASVCQVPVGSALGVSMTILSLNGSSEGLTRLRKDDVLAVTVSYSERMQTNQQREEAHGDGGSPEKPGVSLQMSSQWHHVDALHCLSSEM